MSDYWTSERFKEVEAFKKTMSRNRFSELRSVLKFAVEGDEYCTPEKRQLVLCGIVGNIVGAQEAMPIQSSSCMCQRTG